MWNNILKGPCQASANNSTTVFAPQAYNFNKNKNSSVNLQAAKDNATTLLKYFFASIPCLIGKPVFIISPKKVIIHLCVYKGSATKSSSGHAADLANNLKYLGFMLTKIFNKEVDLELVPLHYPYHDSNILAQLIGLNSNKYNFNKMLATLFNKAYIQTNSSDVAYTNTDTATMLESADHASPLPVNAPVSQLTGIKIKIAGRLASQRIVPKSTVKTAYKGTLSSSGNSTGGAATSVKNFVDTASYTSKNKIGAYTVTVTLGHKITN